MLLATFLFLSGAFTTPAEDTKLLEIKRGSEIKVDGVLSPGEWDDAGQMKLTVGANWGVTVRYKHDGANLLFAFSPVASGAGDAALFRFPELLLDPENKKSDSWQPGQWWLHASANDCEGNGEFNVYRKDGKFLCAKEKPGWTANNWPFAETPVIEISVSFSKAGIKPDVKRRIGFALDLTDTRNSWTFWPASAKIENPATWGEALILP